MTSIKPRLHQTEAMNFHRSNNMLGSLLYHGMGLGKASRNSALVYTPRGPIPMGQIRVGMSVIGMDGKPKRVNSVHPQGLKKFYRVTFNDGAATECCGEHLWSVRSPGQKARGAAFKVKKLDDLKDDLYAPNGNRRWGIPMTGPVEYEAQEIKIPAYTLGVLLGDGSLSHKTTSFTNASTHIFEKVKEELRDFDVDVRRDRIEKDNTYLVRITKREVASKHQIHAAIKAYEVNTLSKLKHIPPAYKYNILEVRLGMLGGLLDTDGYVMADGTVQYSSASKQLVLDLNEIVTSLGGNATFHHKITNTGTDAWYSTLKIPNQFLGCITKPEKAARVRPLLKYDPVRYMADVQEMGYDECTCISVEGEHYLTDNHIVTHNTLTSLWLAQEHLEKMKEKGVVAPRFTVIAPKSAEPTWKSECFKMMPTWVYQAMVFRPYSQLHHAARSAKYTDIRFVIFDESHYLKAPGTKRLEDLSNYLKQLELEAGGFKDGRVMMLSGTPMLNGAQDLYTSWAVCAAPTLTQAAEWLMDTDRFEKWKKSFAQKKEKNWTEGKGKYQKTANDYKGVANEEMLNKLISPFTHFKRVSDCIDLPERLDIPLDLGLPDDKLLKDADLERPEAYMALLERLSRAKTPHMLSWVDTYLQSGEKQLIVFANYRFPLEEMRDKHPKDVRLITGAESKEDRAINLKDFQDGKFRVLGLTFQAGSESLNLQNCHVSLYLSYPWTSARLNQAMARTFRQGQKEKTLHYFLTSGYEDRRILNLVLEKGEATARVEDQLLGNTIEVSLEDLV